MHSYHDRPTGYGNTFKATRLFVGQIAFNAEEHHLLYLFRAYGNVTEVFILRNPYGLSKGAAFVSYNSVEEADCAIAALHDRYYMLPEKALQVSYAKSSVNISDWGRRHAIAVYEKDHHNPVPHIPTEIPRMQWTDPYRPPALDPISVVASPIKAMENDLRV
ncbi:RNA-binding protein [Perkinsela sp. CCAP 1560/4]|nr:RNA-binding protein [Perkinsela sp. CCAP 1560/4]|eukprot:KNH09218.1 RNA-binding protein [Perkinsela sp. CCAP 1560/4]